MSKPQPQQKTHKLEFNHRFGPAILLNGMSRSIRKIKKATAAIKAGDLLQLIQINEDKSKTNLGTAPVTEIHATQLDRFGMTIQREGVNPYRATNLKSLATLFGFETYDHLIQFHQDIEYLSREEDDAFDGVTICWDPSALVIPEAPAQEPSKSKGKGQNPQNPPNLDLDLKNGAQGSVGNGGATGFGGGGSGSAIPDAGTETPKEEDKPETGKTTEEGPFLVADMPGNLSESFEESFGAEIKGIADHFKAHDLVIITSEDEEVFDIFVFRDDKGAEIARGEFEALEEKATAGASADAK